MILEIKPTNINTVAFRHQNSFSTLTVYFLEGFQVVFYYNNLVKHTCKKDGIKRGKETDATSDTFLLSIGETEMNSGCF